MHRMTVKHQRRILRGWLKWTPVLAIPFSILFFHAWLNIQILRADYVLRELDAEARDLTDRLNHTGIAQTIHEDPEVLAAQAGTMNFVPPQPGQREVIRYDPNVPLVHLEDTMFDLALRDTPAQPDPLGAESRANTSANTNTSTSTAPALQPVDSGVVAAPVASSAPVPLEMEGQLESVDTVEAPADPDTAAETVVLSLPEDAYVEESHGLVDTGMGALESL